MPWLMKAEPDSRVVKGKDVKFSVDDFEKIGISPWDGVRNHEAKNIMKTKMKLGDKVLFYHSNCKVPGVYALAEIEKEGYPDYTAWDESHPYFDAKTDKDNPTWYMVNVKFKSRLEHPPTLALIKHLTSLSALPDEVGYIKSEGLDALKEMPLVNRGRLSVQPVSEKAYEAIVKLGTEGGWDALLPTKGAKPSKAKSETKTEEEEAKPARETEAPNKVRREGVSKPASKRQISAKSKVKQEERPEDETDGQRRSKRIRK